MRNGVSISMAVVLFKDDTDSLDKLINNLFLATSKFKYVTLFLINNSPEDIALTSFIKQEADKDKRIKLLLPEKNNGFGAGNNLVLSSIASTYHFIINPDISIPDDSQVPKIINYLENNLEIGLLSPLIKYPTGEIQHLLKKESTVFDMALRFSGLSIFKKRQLNFVNLPDGYHEIHGAENVPGSFMVFRTSVFKEIHGFDEKFFLYMEDSDITKKVNKISKAIFFPDAFVYHEWQRNNRKSLKGISIMLRSVFVYFNKWGWKLF